MSESSKANAPKPFPDSFCRDIEDALMERHALQLKPGERIAIRGELGHSHSMVCTILGNEARTLRCAFDVSVECEPNDIQNPIKARDLALNFVDQVLHEFFEEGRMIHFRPSWQEYPFQELRVLMRGEVTNPHLEEEADKFLAAHGFDPEGESSA